MKIEEESIPTGLDSPLSGGNKDHVKIVSKKINIYKSLHNFKGPVLLRMIEEFRQEHAKDKPKSAVMNADYFRKFYTNPTELRPTDQQLNLLYNYLDHCGAWNTRTANRGHVREIDDPIFYSMLEFLEIPELTTTNLLNRLPGIYRVYRPIVTHPGKFVCGAVQIKGDAETGKISYIEINRIKKQDGREAKSITFEGYAFRKTNFVFLFSAEKWKSSIHLTMLSHCEVQDDKYNVMFGGFLDTIGGQAYTGKVFFERIPDIAEDDATFQSISDELDCLEKTALPKSIQAFFDEAKLVGDVWIY